MRTFLLLLCTTVFSLTSGDIFSQETKVVIEEDKIVTIDEIFDLLREQTQYSFIYREDLFKNYAKVSLKKGVIKVNDLLKQSLILDNVKLRFTDDNKIIVTKIEANAEDAGALQFQVAGVVTDSYGVPLPGANILEKGTSNGTQTDFDGKFSLSLTNSDAIIVISYLGYSTQEVTVNNQTNITVALDEAADDLDEVIVVGYGTQKKVNLTGAVDVIDGELLENRPSPTVSQLLQGTSPSLTFNVGSFGFQPGANLGIQIRGLGSLNGGAPYVLIDNIPGDLNRLNPDDVESISVLKDAAASAVYGARAPYGVILVTTKSGKNQKLRISYSGNVSIASPQNLPSMLNSYLHARAINEAGTAIPGGGGRFFSNTIIDNIVAFQAGDFDFIRSRPNFPSDATSFETTPRAGGNSWGFNQFGNANRDWFDEYYGSGVITKHDLSISGGSEKTSYYFSAGYFDQEGVLNYGTDTFDRFNVLAKITTSLSDKWDITYQPRFSRTVREIPNMDRQGSYDLIFHQIARTMPTNAKYDGYGNIMIQSKIPWVNDAGTDVTETIENWQSITTELRPLNGWKINADFSYRNTSSLLRSAELTVFDNLVDRSQVRSGNTVPSNYRATHNNNTYWTSNITSTYDLSLNNVHNFSVLVGFQIEEAKFRGLTAFRTNLLVQDVPSLNTADGEISSSENLLTTATQGFFGRFKYNYKEKYLLELNGRYDGSSRFRQGNRKGFFPSFSVGWNIDKESFWEPISGVVNTMKLKGSWGELGNQNVASFLDLPLIPLSGNPVGWIFGYGQSRPIGFAGTPGLISPDLTWETARTLNVGTSMSFLDRRLKLDFDWFERTTLDMIGPAQSAPGVLGATVPRLNNAELRSRGWEVNLNWSDRLENGLTYNIGVNLYDSEAVVTKYLNPTGTLNDWYEGRAQGEIWGYTSNGLFQTQQEIDDYTAAVDLSDITGLTWNTGDVKYEDTSGDGRVDNGSRTLEDPGDLRIIGNSTPRYQYGINLGANYKGFDFSMVWKGVGKRDLWFGANENIFWGFRTGNQSSLFPHHLDYFRDQPGDEYTGVALGDANINTNAYFPRPYINNGQNNKNRWVSTRYLQNGAYLRLQNVQLGYSLPTEVVQKMGLSNLRLYVSGENLITISDLPKGIDPLAVSSRWGAGKTYGADRILSLGLKVTY